MAASPFPTAQYTSDCFVESAGAIPFNLSKRQVCLLSTKKGAVLLAKGRRNVGESRQTAAIREAREETGFTCHLLPVTMTTRNPPALEDKQYRDIPRTHVNICEPFMVTHRLLAEGNMKIIWWYMAYTDEEVPKAEGESTFHAQFYSFDEALEALTFEPDRVVLRRAIEIFTASRPVKED